MGKLKAAAAILIFSTLVSCGPGAEQARLRMLEKQKDSIENKLASERKGSDEAGQRAKRCFQIADSLGKVAKDKETLIASYEKRIEYLEECKKSDSLNLMAVLDKIKLNDMKMEIADEKTRIIETGVNKQESAEKWVVRVLLLAIVSLAIIRIGGWMRED